MPEHRNSSAGDPASLARMLSLDDAGETTDGDLAAMLAHQLAAPLGADLKLSDGQRADLQGTTSFADLLWHPNPPTWLLEEIKQFAKRNRAHGDACVRQIAAVVYYLSIAAGLRCNARITELSDHQLREGLSWAVSQTWIDPASRQQLSAARDSLAGDGR